MFELDWAKLVVIGVVALIAIGPKELPTVLRTVGQWMGKMRRMAADFQGQFQEAMREAEMADLKKQVDEISDAAKDLTKFDPLQSTLGDIKAAAEPAPDALTGAPTTQDSVASLPPHAPDRPSPPPAPSGVDLAVAMPEPVPPVTEKDFAATAEAKPAVAEHPAPDRPA